MASCPPRKGVSRLEWRPGPSFWTSEQIWLRLDWWCESLNVLFVGFGILHDHCTLTLMFAGWSGHFRCDCFQTWSGTVKERAAMCTSSEVKRQKVWRYMYNTSLIKWQALIGDHLYLPLCLIRNLQNAFKMEMDTSIRRTGREKLCFQKMCLYCEETDRLC